MEKLNNGDLENKINACCTRLSELSMELDDNPGKDRRLEIEREITRLSARLGDLREHRKAPRERESHSQPAP